MVKFLDLTAQYESLEAEIDGAIAQVIADNAFIGGKYARRFEAEFADFQKADHCIGVGNGTDALEIALEALELPPGSEVVVPANSFIASPEAVTRAGLRVVFCDCDPKTYTMSVASLREKITERTSAIMPVHLYGHPCDMDAITAVAEQHGLAIVEDCAQAHGCEYRGRRVGTFGDFAAFSFYPGKNLGAYGDAGAILTNDAARAKRARMIANHGRVEKYDHEFEGRNSRLDGIQAAILSVKLQHLEGWLEARRRVADGYREGLAGCDAIAVPTEAEWARHVYHLFVVRTDRRDALREHLQDRGIQTGIHYPIALPKLAAYSYLDQGGEDFFAHRTDSTLLSLPIGEHLAPEDVDTVVAAVRDFV